MKVVILLLFVLFFAITVQGQRRYSGSRHTSSHGGHYSGGHGKSHKGGGYKNSNTGNHYGRHKRR